MTYFLGKDCDIFITTEHKYLALSGSSTADLSVVSGMALANVGGGTDGYYAIPPRASGAQSATVVTDVTGIDFSPAPMNEDISYFGRNTNLSAEIKKEFVVTLTRKVTNSLFDRVYNSARDGVYNTSGADATTGTNKIHDGLTTSNNQNFGYRLYLKFKDDDVSAIPNSEVMAIRNACVTSHTRTATPDSAQEETIEFYSYVQPILASGQTSSDLVNLTGYAQI